ncbi:unnamed protein product [Effrenium voratum]|nr:unnamed protein product [Effrenium voratum]
MALLPTRSTAGGSTATGGQARGRLLPSRRDDLGLKLRNGEGHLEVKQRLRTAEGAELWSKRLLGPLAEGRLGVEQRAELGLEELGGPLVRVRKQRSWTEVGEEVDCLFITEVDGKTWAERYVSVSVESCDLQVHLGAWPTNDQWAERFGGDWGYGTSSRAKPSGSSACDPILESAGRRPGGWLPCRGAASCTPCERGGRGCRGCRGCGRCRAVMGFLDPGKGWSGCLTLGRFRANYRASSEGL